MYSDTIVKNILESAIDNMIDNFIVEPYMHRCEHSVHCELYNMLTVHRALQGFYKLNDTVTLFKTSIVHKEWPETIPRESKNGRRGNFDLAILDPKMIQQATITEFFNGHITPSFVVELGLNYGINHLIDDHEKLINSKINTISSDGDMRGYLVHLWQPHKGLKSHDIDKLMQWVVIHPKNVAVALRLRDKTFIKHIGDRDVRQIV